MHPHSCKAIKTSCLTVQNGIDNSARSASLPYAMKTGPVHARLTDHLQEDCPFAIRWLAHVQQLTAEGCTQWHMPSHPSEAHAQLKVSSATCDDSVSNPWCHRALVVLNGRHSSAATASQLLHMSHQHLLSNRGKLEVLKNT